MSWCFCMEFFKSFFSGCSRMDVSGSTTLHTDESNISWIDLKLPLLQVPGSPATQPGRQAAFHEMGWWSSTYNDSVVNFY